MLMFAVPYFILIIGFLQVPHVNRTDYQLIDISEDGFVSIFSEILFTISMQLLS